MTPNPRGIDSDPDTDPQRRGPTRRQALALAGGTAVALGATVGPFGGLLDAGAADDDDTGPVESSTASWLMSLELAAAELYADARDADGFDDAARDLAAACAAHHTAQSQALSEMVSAGGGETPDGPNQAFLDRFGPGLAAAPGGAGKAAFLAGLENQFAATYQASFDTLTSPSLAALAAKILATDAAQAVAWSAVANSFDGGNGLPSEDAIPESQTGDDAFDRSDLAPNPPAEESSDDGDTGDDTGATDDDGADAEGGATDDDAATSTGEES